MNPFCAEHPIVSQPSMLDSKAYPMLSYFCRSCVLAVILTPVFFGLMLYSDLNYLNEIGAQVGLISLSWLDLVLGMGETFVFCLLIALVLVWLCRLIRVTDRATLVSDPLPSTGRGIKG
jgi:hypothetical protein